MEHYFTNNENLKSEIQQTQAIIKNQKYTFYTDHGVFSKKGLDFGTRSLLESLPFDQLQGNILDFGCGYGPIGIVLAKETKANIDMLDINKRSLFLAQKNAKKNEVNVHIFESNLYQNVDKQYDYIITNPPIRVGKKILYEILIGAKKYLKNKGQLWFVIHKDQGAKTVIRDLEEYYQVKIIEKNKGFYCIQAKNN